PDAPENHHALSVLMTRLMFLMFCEDCGLVPVNGFRDYVQHYQAEDLRKALLDLFVWLDTPDSERDRYASDLLKALPYMDGGLFRERTEVPPLSEDFRTTLIVDGCQEFDWSGVSPTVFGSIFEGALSHDQRRANGQHFTSPENIHKVIDPLFLDDLEREFEEAKAKPVAGGARTKALQELHERIGSISVLDPAAGSGNFLTESYLCLRRLENRILFELASDGQASMSFEEAGDQDVLVSLASFHGIELEDFACCVARTALWIAEKQADEETAKVTKRVYEALPLTDYDNIIQGNALRMDWNDVVPASEVDYVCGNPPFIGYSNLDEEQKKDRVDVFGKAGGVLDYVACWYKRAADYIRGHHVRCAFVSTNSICQGQQVEPLWRPLFEDGIHIDFAYRTFVWNSEATDEAHVHVIIVGFSRENVSPKILWDESGKRRDAANINAYLSIASSNFITRRSKPLCDVPEMAQGFKPADNGNLLLSSSERDELLATEPMAARWIRPFSMGAEFVKGQERYCLWLPGITAAELKELPQVKARVEACREWRSSQVKSGDAYKLKDTPHLLRPCRKFVDATYIGVPKVTSGRRRYVPLGFVTNGMIPGDKLYFIPTSSLYLFGVLMSQFHNAWMRVVAGRLKSDYSYGNTIVYNNFVFPDPTTDQHAEIERCAQAVLDVRDAHPGDSLADMYDPDNDFLYPDLMAAHKALDAAVEAAYGVDFGGDEEKIVAHLFELYAERTRGN
ncbi:MAG: class I SAM-dependent DNA methyltransferase, partial [Coriobacteriales bacterium]